ncbi:MAG TPA: redoxin domain-containing protein [Saprospiraceae bacterium]|nr:redoxin domain-containing protein [Saprospiraceae bacterium]HMQ82511.1 redoxin domain-containing protein [Saprospiraceae bacterium]
MTPGHSKALFVSAYVGFLSITLLFILYQWAMGVPVLAWLGLLLSILPGVLYFSVLYLFKNIARTGIHMETGTRFTLFASLFALVSLDTSEFPVLVYVWVVVAALGWLVYVYWGTNLSDRKPAKVQVGQKMPDQHLKDHTGRSRALSDFFNAPAVFVFYRGNWCPFCVAQVKELARSYQLIREKGAHLVFISPQNEVHTTRLATSLKIPAVFLVDKNLAAAKTLGILHQNGTPTGLEVLGYTTDNVLPTVIVTDQGGIVRFLHETDNYRIRPEPETYLEMLNDSSIQTITQ